MKPNNEIFFRASGNGALMTDGRGTVLTDNMKKDLEDFKTKLRNGGKLTDPQKLKFDDYIKRENAPFELSDTAKSFVKENWLWLEKGFYKALKTDFTDKGIFNEEEGLSLMSRVHGNFYKKNTTRKYKGNLTGECDVEFKQGTTKIILDVKNCWDAKTFINAKPDKIYDWQGETYMDLYEADEFWLCYTLTDCPDHLLNKQKEKLWRQYYDESMSPEEASAMEERMTPMFEQIERNLVYSNSKLYTEEERIKIFKYQRDGEKFKLLLDRIPSALEYYQTIKLNDITL
jgi:hypothetical protein